MALEQVLSPIRITKLAITNSVVRTAQGTSRATPTYPTTWPRRVAAQ